MWVVSLNFKQYASAEVCYPMQVYHKIMWIFYYYFSKMEQIVFGFNLTENSTKKGGVSIRLLYMNSVRRFQSFSNIKLGLK